MNNTSNTSIGCSTLLAVLLTILFIALKLCNVINWAWIWVLAPLWIDFAIDISIIIIVAILYSKFN